MIPYYGNLSFDYSGAMNGTFNAELIIEDDMTIPTSGAIGTIAGDETSSGAYILALQPTEGTDDAVDLFIMFMKNMEGELQPGTWDVVAPDITDLEGIESTMLLLPAIDSTFVADLIAPVVDGEVDEDNFMEYFGGVIVELAVSAFLPMSGSISLDEIEPAGFSGGFSGSLMFLDFPPQFLTISNGSYDLQLPGADIIPMVPENFSAVYADPNVLLSWDLVEQEVVHHYVIYRGMSELDLWPLAAVPVETVTYSDEDVSGGNTYYYAIASANIIDIEGPLSDVLSVTIPGGLLGDVNQDMSIDVLDIVLIVDFILGTPPNDYQAWASDYNQDDSIDVLDIVLIVDVIMGT